MPPNGNRTLQPLQALASSTCLDCFIAAARQAVAAHLATYPDSHEDVYRVMGHPHVDVQAFINGPDDWLLALVGVIERQPRHSVEYVCVIATYDGPVGDEPSVQVRPGLYLWAAQDSGYSAETVIAALEEMAYLVQS